MSKRAILLLSLLAAYGGQASVCMCGFPSPDDKVSPYGDSRSIGSDLEGTYYDCTRARTGRDIGMGVDAYQQAVGIVLKSDWDWKAFRRFYRAPEKRYITCMILPTMSSSAAPAAFGEAPGSDALWIIHYKGEIVYPEEITFRFWGVADDFMLVRVGEKIVFADALSPSWNDWDEMIKPLWESKDPPPKRYFIGYDTKMEVGDWITLKAGQPLDMEVLMGGAGGQSTFMLLVEVKGVEYERNRWGSPILPAFRTARLSQDMLDLINKKLAPNVASLTTGPVFNDYASTDAEKKE